MSDEGSGPVDGQEIKLDLIPHHQKHAVKKEGGLFKTLLTGGVIIGGIVGVYMLWKHFFGKKKGEAHHPPGQGGAKGKGGGGHRKRALDTEVVEDELAAVYAEALADEEFMDFLERFVEVEDFEGV